MKYEINEEVRGNTNCEYDYSCLMKGNCGDCAFCKADTAIYKDGLLLDTQKKKAICSFHMTYNFGEMCVCPVRFAIYQKYHV